MWCGRRRDDQASLLEWVDPAGCRLALLDVRSQVLGPPGMSPMSANSMPQ